MTNTEMSSVSVSGCCVPTDSKNDDTVEHNSPNSGKAKTTADDNSVGPQSGGIRSLNGMARHRATQETARHGPKLILLAIGVVLIVISVAVVTPVVWHAVRVSEGPQCEPIWLLECQGLSYTMTSFPNALGDPDAITAAMTAMDDFHVLYTNACHDFIKDYWCGVYFPPCESGRQIAVCRDLCQEIQNECSAYRSVSGSLGVDCSALPNTGCFHPAKLLPSVRTCQAMPHADCLSHGYNQTASPNILGHYGHWSDKEMRDISKVNSASHCHENLMQFGCSMLYPPCLVDEDGQGTTLLPPCRQLCQEVQDKCGFFLRLQGVLWAAEFNCSILPESPDRNTCLAPATVHQGCRVDEHRCGGQDGCVPRQWVCDGQPDCTDGSDEHECDGCAERMFQCDNKDCIANTRMCDQVADCSYAEDERHCTRLQGGGLQGVLERYQSATSQWTVACSDDSDHDSLVAAAATVCQALSVALVITNRSLVPCSSQDGSSRSIPGGHAMFVECTFNKAAGLRLPPFQDLVRNRNSELLDGSSWPWLVSLHGGPDRNYFCSGTIIHPRWILTAAHCLGAVRGGFNVPGTPSDHATYGDTNGWTIIAGTSRRLGFSERRQVRGVERVIPYPNRTTDSLNPNDIGLIKVAEAFQQTTSVSALTLQSRSKWLGDDSNSLQQCYVAGWGKILPGDGDYQPAARLRRLTVVSQAACEHLLSVESGFQVVIDDTRSLCAVGRPGTDVCNGDSGALLVCQTTADPGMWFPTAVVSWGQQCGNPQVPGGNVRIEPFLSWIHDTIDNS